MATAGHPEARSKDAKTSFEPLIPTSADAEEIPVDKVEGMPDVAGAARRLQVGRQALHPRGADHRSGRDRLSRRPAQGQGRARNRRRDTAGEPTTPKKDDAAKPADAPQIKEREAADQRDRGRRHRHPRRPLLGADLRISSASGSSCPSPSNGDFVANAVDVLAGGNDLISLRSRGTSARPFEVVDQIQRDADGAVPGQREGARGQAQGDRGQDQGAPAEQGRAPSRLTAEQSQAIDNFRGEMLRTRQQLREVQLALRQDIDRLKAELEFFDIALHPDPRRDRRRSCWASCASTGASADPARLSERRTRAMHSKGVISLMAVTALSVVVAAAVSFTGGAVAAVDPLVGKPVLPAVAAKLGDIGKVVVKRVGGTATLRAPGQQLDGRGEGRLSRRCRQGATSCCSGLAEITYVEPKTAEPNLYKRLNVEDPSAEKSQSALVEVYDDARRRARRGDRGPAPDRRARRRQRRRLCAASRRRALLARARHARSRQRHRAVARPAHRRHRRASAPSQRCCSSPTAPRSPSPATSPRTNSRSRTCLPNRKLKSDTGVVEPATALQAFDLIGRQSRQRCRLPEGRRSTPRPTRPSTASRSRWSSRRSARPDWVAALSDGHGRRQGQGRGRHAEPALVALGLWHRALQGDRAPHQARRSARAAARSGGGRPGQIGDSAAAEDRERAGAGLALHRRLRARSRDPVLHRLRAHASRRSPRGRASAPTRSARHGTPPVAPPASAGQPCRSQVRLRLISAACRPIWGGTSPRTSGARRHGRDIVRRQD